MTAVSTAGPRAGRREWLGFGVLMLPLLLVSMDVSVLYFAVPFISRELAPTSTQQLWIFDMYGFVLAGLLITMGSLGDRIGRRRLLLLGAAAFGAASLLAAYAGSAEVLILARALLGIGGATLMPSTLGLIRNMFRDDKQRGTAIAIWTAAMTGGIAVGPVLSGFLLEHFWWGAIFLINIPAMALLLILGPILLPEFRTPRAGGFDLVSSLLSLATVLPVIYGIKELARDGFAPLPAAGILGGLVVGAVFVHRQRTRPDPMIDVALFRRRAFGASLLVNMLGMFAMVGFAIFTTQYLQLVLDMSPLRAALWSLLPTVGVGAAAPLAAVAAQKVNRAYVMAVGFVVAAGGFAVLTTVRAWSSLWPVMIGASLYAAGIVVVMSLVTDVVLGEAPPERASSVSGLLESATEFAGALGMALLGSVGSAVYRNRIGPALPDSLPTGAAGEARETLAGALDLAAGLPGGTGGLVLAAARAAFLDGMHAAAVAAGAVMLLAAALCVLLLRHAHAADAAAARPDGPPDPGSAHPSSDHPAAVRPTA
ncbi:MFS transporter [Micromonospora sp. R77]|uniref:MFS transporter n=1 Tax=Micromonospora sp. R77 TaxID=2925836 RepID=UPI001F60C723|nr:MFS transporter [Micromonospora sp. R77]MCI4061601.1 MFS transporter [Micromonospora sp. R77]